MSTESTSTPRPSELVAGFLAVISMAGSALALFWDPLRVSPFAVLLALIAIGMAPPKARLPMIAVGVGAFCFFAGMTIAVITSHRLY